MKQYTYTYMHMMHSYIIIVTAKIGNMKTVQNIKYAKLTLYPFTPAG